MWTYVRVDPATSVATDSNRAAEMDFMVCRYLWWCDDAVVASSGGRVRIGDV